MNVKQIVVLWVDMGTFLVQEVYINPPIGTCPFSEMTLQATLDSWEGAHSCDGFIRPVIFKFSLLILGDNTDLKRCFLKIFSYSLAYVRMMHKR